ncbi:hypothetical protein EMMF5_004838 [Cystobasidiomycetes sp. EMM_F5]
MITSTIEISAPPAIVRDVVKSFFLSEEGECCHTDSVPYLIKWLNFKDVSEWHQGFIESVEVEYSSEPGLVSGHKLKPGDRLHTFAAGMEFHQTILENDEEHIKWYGPWWGLLNGTHEYSFKPSSVTPGGTTFTQTEWFSGILSPFMLPSMPGGKKTQLGFDSINKDVKTRAESLFSQTMHEEYTTELKTLRKDVVAPLPPFRPLERSEVLISDRTQ